MVLYSPSDVYVGGWMIAKESGTSPSEVATDAWQRFDDASLPDAIFSESPLPGEASYVASIFGRRDRSKPEAFDFDSPSPFETSAVDHLSETFDLFPRNVLLVKLNYLFMR